ncbi:hypothetical protein [Mycobacterium shimoidei]|nr:hypothetical protein [Mycobacterium shimoidei]
MDPHEPWHPATTPEEIRTRFPALSNPRAMAPNANTQVRAIDRAEQITAQVWGDGAAADAILFNPARVPALAARADAAAAEFHRRESEASRERAQGLAPSLHYNTYDTEYDPDTPAEQGVVQIWRVGTNHVNIVRDRWHDQVNRDRRMSPAAEMASVLQHDINMLDRWDCAEYGCDGDCDLSCTVHIAKACGGTTRLLPVNRGTLVLLFRCCRVCEVLAGKIAANTYQTNAKIAELEAREDWPPDTP